MSFRIEEKLSINFNQIFEFKKWLNCKGFKKLYEDRIIKSLYFENQSNKMFSDSEEGTVPRKKIRVRSYPYNNISNEYFLELKISSVEGRYKSKKKIDLQYLNKILNFGYMDKFYGTCYPKLSVSYLREYFKCNDSRITIDNNILYEDYKNKNISKKDEVITVEIKSNYNQSSDKLHSQFPFQRIRFSKYCRGFINLYY